MRIRTSALVCLVAAGLPLLGGLGVTGLPLGPTEALAQAADAVTTLARERFLEGVKAYDAGRYEDARSLFLQAYALKRHPAVLLNLGQAELKTGHVVEGGNHLQQFLREHKAATPDQVDAAKKGVAEARKTTGHVIVIVDVDGAQVAIDGTPAGVTPLLDPVFVAPGEHTIAATAGGKTATGKVTVARGSVTPVTLGLQALGVSPPPATAAPPVPTAPATTEPISTGPTSTGAPYPTQPPPGYPPIGPDATGPGPMSTAPPPEPAPSGGYENFFTWFAKKPLAWVFTGVGGLGLIGTIGFGAAAGSAKSAQNTVQDDILAEVAKWQTNQNASGHLPESYYEINQDGARVAKPCGPIDDASKDYSYYANACSQLRDNIKAYDTDVAMTIVSAALLTVGVAADIIYYVVDGKQSTSQAGNDGPRIVGLGPVVTPTEQGVGLLGTF
jgi:hypothetical protein